MLNGRLIDLVVFCIRIQDLYIHRVNDTVCASLGNDKKMVVKKEWL